MDLMDSLVRRSARQCHYPHSIPSHFIQSGWYISWYYSLRNKYECNLSKIFTPLDFTQTRYFEAHSTETLVGDPIKASAIAGIFNAYRSKQDPLFINTIESNLGHLERKAGIAGLIKTIMVLKSGIISPRIWFEKLNPSIPLDESIHGLISGFDERLLLLLVIEAVTPMLSWRTHTAT